MNIDINDVLFFIGWALLGYGLWTYSPSVSMTITGGILMWIAYSRAGGEND